MFLPYPEQDVGTATQIGAMLGLRAVSDAPLRNYFAAVDAYAAGRTSRSLVAREVESRLDLKRFE